MNNESFSRLLGLMEKLGLSVESGTFNRAECAAYARAVCIACDEMESTMKNLFIDSAETQGLALFLSLIGRSPAETEEKSKELVIESVSEEFGTRRLSDFENALANLGNGFGYEGNGCGLMIKRGEASGTEFAEKFSDFITDYAPGFSRVEIDGTSTDLGTREAANLRWFELDALNLPFSVLDNF